MEPRYLLDTNICIYLRHRKSEAVIRRFQRLRAGEAAISVITYGELFYGAEKSSHSQMAIERMQELALLIPPLPLPEGAATLYGATRAKLQATGNMIGNNDLWIAAHALAEQLILVTNNENEFRRVPGLKTENWA